MNPPLGCGNHRAFIAARGGTPILAELPYDTLTGGHILNDVGTASVTVSADKAPKCDPILGDLEPWEHELLIFRDEPQGAVMVEDTDPWWAGPVSTVGYTPTQLQVNARDLWTWFEKRDLPVDVSFTATDLASIFATYMANAYDLDPTPNITLTSLGLSGITGSRSVTGLSSTRAADALRELGRSGVNWSTWGRIVTYGGSGIPPDPLCILYDAAVDYDSQSPQLTKQGPNAATRVTVNGGTIPGTSIQARGEAGGPDTQHGLVQRTVSESQILDNASAKANAENQLAFTSPAPKYLTAILREKAPLMFGQLLPGSRIDVAMEIGLHTEIGAYRLQSMTVTANGTDGAEAVAVSLAPLFVPSGGA